MIRIHHYILFDTPSALWIVYELQVNQIQCKLRNWALCEINLLSAKYCIGPVNCAVVRHFQQVLLILFIILVFLSACLFFPPLCIPLTFFSLSVPLSLSLMHICHWGGRCFNIDPALMSLWLFILWLWGLSVSPAFPLTPTLFALPGEDEWARGWTGIKGDAYSKCLGGHLKEEL